MSGALGRGGAAWKVAAVALMAGLVAAGPAHADAVDTAGVSRVVIGVAPGPSPGERGDARRTGRSAVALPATPIEIWKRSVGARLEMGPVVAKGGDIVVAPASSELVRFDLAGRERARLRLPGAAAAPAVVLADGGVAVVTVTGVALAFDAAGAPRWSVPLGVRPRETDVGIVARERGTVVVTLGRAIVEIDGAGTVVARTTLDERVVGAAVAGAGRRGVLVAGESGSVYEIVPPAGPRVVGSLGGLPRRGIVWADDRTMVAVVDARRLVALDLPTQTRQVRAAPAGALLDAPPTVTARGETRITSSAGLMLRIDPDGSPRPDVLVDRTAATLGTDSSAAAGGFFGNVEPRASPPLVADAYGRIAFARAGGRVGVVGPEGDVTVVGERLCDTPLALVPAAPRRMVLACRDGTLWMLGDP